MRAMRGELERRERHLLRQAAAICGRGCGKPAAVDGMPDDLRAEAGVGFVPIYIIRYKRDLRF